MVDNQRNYFHTAPDKGTINGPKIRNATLAKYINGIPKSNSTLQTRQSSDYWLGSVPHGIVSLKPQPPETSWYMEKLTLFLDAFRTGRLPVFPKCQRLWRQGGWG